MAPTGRYTHSRLCLFALGLAIVFIIIAAVAVFPEKLVDAMVSLRETNASCSCPAIPDHKFPDDDNEHLHQHLQPLRPTIYREDLNILDELPSTNVLWVNLTTSPTPEAWGISMFHALHCVKMWRDSLAPTADMNSHVHSEAEYVEHADHCIKYLVQSIFCTADSTIEPAERIIVGDKSGKRIHGMGYSHQCGDPSLLFEMDGQVVQDWGWKMGDTLYSVFG